MGKLFTFEVKFQKRLLSIGENFYLNYLHVTHIIGDYQS